VMKEAVSNVSRELQIRELLENNLDKISEMLPSHLRSVPGYANKLVKAAMVAINNPRLGLAKCTSTSIMQSVLKAAELGLDPSGTLGAGYLIAYGDQCTFSPGYRGLIDLATRGEDSRVSDIMAYLVREGDEFSYRLGSNPNIEHIPMPFGNPSREIIGAYMVATLKDGTKKYEVMSREELDEVRSKSKAPNGAAWRDFPGQMFRKVVIRRGMSYLPISAEILSLLGKSWEDDDKHVGCQDAIKHKDVNYSVITGSRAGESNEGDEEERNGETVEEGEFGF